MPLASCSVAAAIRSVALLRRPLVDDGRLDLPADGLAGAVSPGLSAGLRERADIRDFFTKLIGTTSLNIRLRGEQGYAAKRPCRAAQVSLCSVHGRRISPDAVGARY